MMKPQLCFKVFLCDEYEAYLREFGDNEEIKNKFEAMIIAIFEEYGVTVDEGKFDCHVTGHRGGIE